MKDNDTIILENLTSLILERNNNLPFISIDIQPAYRKYCDKVMRNFASFVNTQNGRIVCFFNGSEVGLDDTADFLKEYFFDWGVTEEALDKIEFREKGYAFFRNWMDMGMDRRDIIKAIRYMVQNRITDSREVEDETWATVFGDSWGNVQNIVTSDMIYMPDINIGELKSLGGCYLGGGGKDECLSEFRFLLESFNIKYTLVSNLVY